MTCIVGIRHGGKVTLGGDSAGVAGTRLMMRADEKVFIRTDAHEENWAFAYTTSFRMGQLLRFKLSLPTERPGKHEHGLFEFMASHFIDAVRKCFKDGGFAEKEREAEQGGHFLVGFRGDLFLIEGDYQVARPLDHYAAHGCGMEVALGALFAVMENHTAEEMDYPVDEVIHKALRASERFSGAVRAPFHTVTV